MLKAGLIDADGNRKDNYNQVVSIGDLLSGALRDVEGDKESLALSDTWIDKLIVGNHEVEYLMPGGAMVFRGYHPNYDLIQAYKALWRNGKVVPSMVVGETLLSHAGVHHYFDFESAAEAHAEIGLVWRSMLSPDLGGPDYDLDDEEWQWPDTSCRRYTFSNYPLDKQILIKGVPKERGGLDPLGGIIWSAWEEQKNPKFNQILGHTPISGGPVLVEYKQAGTFTLNIDAGAKQGLPPAGVWLDEHGLVVEYVTTSALILDGSTSFV